MPHGHTHTHARTRNTHRAGASFGSGYPLAKKILQGKARALGWWHPPCTALASWLALISGIPGGLFDPSFAVGAALGDLIARSPLVPSRIDLDPQARRLHPASSARSLPRTPRLFFSWSLASPPHLPLTAPSGAAALMHLTTRERARVDARGGRR